MRQISEIIQFFWMFESHHHQRLAWRDAAEMRVARERAESQALAQHKAMLSANPSGQLGHSVLDDEDALRNSGLIE
ncbi:hypothetical protein [Devosia sp. MC1541]|uniref:hypothetical protein n=1 Tax=Devosia sp. MC1541 TaxID=2725264 RepID=UPI00145C7519|nr:hypothetical protein [Devosia sp. MC1541]